MDYIYDDNDLQFFIEVKKNDEEERMVRRIEYYGMYFYENLFGRLIKERNSECTKKSKMSTFWNKESCLEQKVYRMMKKWETRHPIMGIVFCTVLGSILLSLMTEIIIDAIIMML